MTPTDRLAALLHAEDCWPDCGNPKEVPAGTLFHRMAARLIAAGVTLAATPAPLRYQPSRDGDMDPDPHGEWVRYDTDDGWQERGNPGDPATPAPLDGHQTPGEYHDYRVACVKCGEPGFLHVSWRPETWADPGSLTAALNEEARK